MHIAVVGGGPGGLTAAALGARMGLKVSLFEARSPSEIEAGAVLLHASGMRILERMGCLGGVIQGLKGLTHLEIALVGDEKLVDVALDAAEAETFLPHMVLRQGLRDVLQAECRRHGAELTFNCQVKGLWQDESGAYLSSNLGGHGPFDAILACDGSASILREQGGFDGKRAHSGNAYLRGIFESRPSDTGLKDIWGPNRTRFATCPMGNGQTAFLCSVPQGAWPHIRDHKLADWIQTWGEFGPDLIQRLEAFSDWKQVTYTEVFGIELKRWYERPIFLLGDAAHGMAPSIGQGVNAAMVDALVLVQLLTRVEGLGASHEDIGQTYENVRRPHLSQIQALSTQLETLANITSQPGRFLRGALLPLAHRFAGLGERILSLTTGGHALEEDYFSFPLEATSDGIAQDDE